MNRRSIALLVASASLVVAACGGSSASPAATSSAESPAPASTEPTAPALPSAEPSATAATTSYPLTVEHKYGSTTIDEAPTRIVTVGLLEQDALLALGITPVGTTEWFGGHPGAIWPWSTDLVTGETPTVVGDATAVSFEKIAALDPDLILGLYSGLTKEQYDQLAGIAPTVAQPEAYVDYGIPWQELTRTVGSIVGKPAEADALVADVEAKFEAAKVANPAFAGATSVVATPHEGIWVYGPEDVRGRLLQALGFELPDGLAEVTGAAFGGNLSTERADMLDVDAIIWLDAKDAEGALGGPLYASLPVHTEGREVHLSSFDDPLGGATSFVTVQSLPYLLDRLVPKLAAAIDGDTATAVP
jgi:iron complex transport system substrate-binding protein